MLEPFTTSLVLLASEMGIIATSIESIAGSLGVIIASLGAATLSISGFLAWVSTILPAPESTEGYYFILHKYINLFGGNLGMAANAITPKVE
jgi:hypothetical protein